MRKLTMAKTTLTLEILSFIIIIGIAVLAILNKEVSLGNYLFMCFIALMMNASAVVSSLGDVAKLSRKR